MKKKLFFSVCLSLPLALFPLSAPAEEGSPLLSVDDLIALEDSYEAFLNELGDLAVQRGLLSEEDRAAESGSVLYVYGNAGTLYIDHTVSVYQTSFHVYEVCVKASWDENGR